MTEDNFQSSFNEKIRYKLYMKDFWTTEPCDWSITNYLIKLFAQDPALTRRSAIEVLLTEVSSGYGSNEACKISFDHHKAMFGKLAMIQTVAHLCEKASFNTFAKLKIHFLHAHGNSIRHWSMSTQAPGIYIMTKEQRVNVPVSFSEKDILIPSFICFFKTLAIACEETLSVLKELKQEHKTILRSKGQWSQNLSSIINPTIIRLNEGKHTSIVAEHGPMSAPNSPNIYPVQT